MVVAVVFAMEAEAQAATGVQEVHQMEVLVEMVEQEDLVVVERQRAQQEMETPVQAPVMVVQVAMGLMEAMEKLQVEHLETMVQVLELVGDEAQVDQMVEMVVQDN